MVVFISNMQFQPVYIHWIYNNNNQYYCMDFSNVCVCLPLTPSVPDQGMHSHFDGSEYLMQCNVLMFKTHAYMRLTIWCNSVQRTQKPTNFPFNSISRYQQGQRAAVQIIYLGNSKNSQILHSHARCCFFFFLFHIVYCSVEMSIKFIYISSEWNDLTEMQPKHGTDILYSKQIYTSQWNICEKWMGKPRIMTMLNVPGAFKTE